MNWWETWWVTSTTSSCSNIPSILEASPSCLHQTSCKFLSSLGFCYWTSSLELCHFSLWFSDFLIFIVKSFVLQIICRLLFRYHYFPNRRGGVAGIGVPPTRRPAAQQFGGGGSGGRHNWGQGYHLGTEWEERRATATRKQTTARFMFQAKMLVFSHSFLNDFSQSFKDWRLCWNSNKDV